MNEQRLNMPVIANITYIDEDGIEVLCVVRTEQEKQQAIKDIVKYGLTLIECRNREILFIPKL